MIGVSLPLDWLITGQGLPETADNVLSALKAEGVRSIELRTVRKHHTAEDVKRVAETLWDKGFLISLHGDAKTAEGIVQELFAPIEGLFHNMRQPSVNITVHPIQGDNVKLLTTVADYITQNSLPVTVALENNRRLPDKTEGDSAALVLEIVKKVDRPQVGICWDMGHYMYWWRKNHPDEPVVLPGQEFLKRVIHTHIHALAGLKTHFPLDTHSLPLKQFLDGLCYEYFGLYNLELEYPRFQELRALLPALVGSVRELRAQMPLCANIYDEVRDNFDRWFLSALTTLDGEDGTKFGLIHSSSYLFNFHGYRVGMDIAFRNARYLAETPSKCASLLKALDLMIISHNHRDHFEESTVKLLAQTDMEWVIPDFLYDIALVYGISPEKIHIAKKDEPLTVGKLTLLPFPGRHFRPGTARGVPEYGYYVTAVGSPSIALPVDVRDFSLEGLPNIPKADYCFANVWLGDGRGLDESFSPLDCQFAELMLHFSHKNILLTHLNEDGRRDKDLWCSRHGELLQRKLTELSPKTKVFIPARGQVIELK
ncbi:MAG: MBL fold metallo-hydrolase [Oscillospiraceae bacterium]|nr:MBL fold metallo-hydrolase [Oscillospiraceae bacterium]